MAKDHIADDYTYGESFYRYIQKGALQSAQTIVPLVAEYLKISSVLDVGCGAGAWLSEYRKAGIPICVGIDGSYVKSSWLRIPVEDFATHNVGQTFDLGRRFDMVQCLEVGEHIENSASRTLIDNLVRHGDLVLFSAAPPGQGGENHINEQPYEFWRNLFSEHGYKPYDFFRPLLRRARGVAGWYRHNLILYVAEQYEDKLPRSVCQTKVSDDCPITDISGSAYKLRTRILSALPLTWVSMLALMKRRCILLARMISGRGHGQ